MVRLLVFSPVLACSWLTDDFRGEDIPMVVIQRKERSSLLKVFNNLTDDKEADTDAPPAHGGLDNSNASQTPQENHMVGDFDDSANALWSLYVDEAKSHDEATIGTIKDDMEGVLIFVRSRTFTLLWPFY